MKEKYVSPQCTIWDFELDVILTSSGSDGYGVPDKYGDDESWGE